MGICLDFEMNQMVRAHHQPLKIRMIKPFPDSPGIEIIQREDATASIGFRFA